MLVEIDGFEVTRIPVSMAVRIRIPAYASRLGHRDAAVILSNSSPRVFLSQISLLDELIPQDDCMGDRTRIFENS